MIERVLQRWRSLGIPLNPGASDAAIARLEARLGAPLPADVRALYAAANGMQDYAHDEMFLFWWSIDFLLSSSGEACSGVDARGAYTDIGFADVLIGTWYFWFRVRGSTVSVFCESSSDEFDTLEAFLTRYLEAPDSLDLCAITEPGFDQIAGGR